MSSYAAVRQSTRQARLRPCALTLLAVLQFAATAAWAQSVEPSPPPAVPTPSPNEIVNMTNEAVKRGNALTALGLLREMEMRLATDRPRDYRIVAELTTHFDATVGNYREALRHFGVAHRGSRPPLKSADEYPLRDLRPQPALSVLASMADGARVVMINEAHHVPQHRAFMIELLPVLWRKGFRYFAAETLLSADGQLQERGYPTATTGYYTAEPVYGDLIRNALRLGYRVIPYEARSGTKDRELAQAQNLVDRIFREQAEAKVLIYTGYDHINESGEVAGVPTLARRLTEMLGIDPLTVDQTAMSERVPEEQEHPVYRYLMESSPIGAPTIFVNAEGRPWTGQPGTRDITLFHPRSKYVNGRPTWLALGGARSPYRIPRKICGAEKRCLVKARPSNESADAIPVDQVEVVADQPAPTLMLPAGNFTVEAQDPAARTLKTVKVARRQR
jgi:hypothetical protein